MKKFTPLAFLKRLCSIVTDRGFLFLTFLGNAFIIIFSVLFYFLERDINPHIGHVFDSIWWGYVTVTTVGYGEITPVTMIGKFFAIFLMIGGIGLFSTYTALFANTLMGREFHKIDKEVRKIKRNVKETQEGIEDFEFEERALLNTMERMTRSIENIDRRLKELEEKNKGPEKG